MVIHYKHRWVEAFLIVLNMLTAAAVSATFVMLFGFDKPAISPTVLHSAQVVALIIFIFTNLIRLLNASHKPEFLQTHWFELPLLIGLVIAVWGSGVWFAKANPQQMQITAIGIYLIVEVIAKLCRTSVSMASTGRNPSKALILSFVVLIFAGAGLLTLPKSTAGKPISIVDSFFTTTSAVCVTGLTVKDTGKDFSLMGQIIILTLIQLGGLGIVIFGAVFSLLLGQAFSVRESVAMQDLTSANALHRIEIMIGFIFAATILIEAAGAFILFPMWDNVPGMVSGANRMWFYSVFHSVSAFCNAGFGLLSDNLVSYRRSWGVYASICPLIVLGGLGFPVLYNIITVLADKVRMLFCKFYSVQGCFSERTSRKLQLQSKIVLATSAALILGGAAALFLFERFDTDTANRQNFGAQDALFQSITARTAGFNTVDIGNLSDSSKLMLILLMIVGGSPASTAGGIKTVTFAVILMSVIATLRKRQEVELFKRAVRPITARRAFTVAMVYIGILLAAIIILTITERQNHFAAIDIMLEAASALGTVGLSAGITNSLTTAGKLIIIVCMLIGRLGPLTLLASLTFNLKPAKYNYPSEPIVVG